MSLLRFLGIRQLGTGPGGEAAEPETLGRIVAQLGALEPERARFVASFAYILARVAHADLKVEACEVTAMERILREVADLEESERHMVVEIAVHQATVVSGTDDYLVTREFRRVSDKSERIRLMRCLYAVAAADDSISSLESREIVEVGEELGLARPEVSALRYEFREKLAVLEQTASEKRTSDSRAEGSDSRAEGSNQAEGSNEAEGSERG